MKSINAFYIHSVPLRVNSKKEINNNNNILLKERSKVERAKLKKIIFF